MPDVRRTRILYEEACAHTNNKNTQSRTEKKTHTEHIKLLHITSESSTTSSTEHNNNNINKDQQSPNEEKQKHQQIIKLNDYEKNNNFNKWRKYNDNMKIIHTKNNNNIRNT